MNKYLLFFLFNFSVGMITHAQWIKQFGGTLLDEPVSIRQDQSGNIYTLGTFESTVDFDPGPGVFNYTATYNIASTPDAFVSKLDAAGNFAWARQISLGWGKSDMPHDMEVDDSGNVYVCGSYYGSGWAEYGFICKYDSSGNLLWTKILGGTSLISAMTISDSGYIYLTGNFAGTTDFDFDTSVHSLTSTSSSFSDLFVLKVNANANYIWVKQFGQQSNTTAQAITTDAKGCIYIGGTFQTTLDLDPSTSTSGVASTAKSSSNYSTYITKWTAAGNYRWGMSVGNHYINTGPSLVADGKHLYIGGSFEDSIDFNPSLTAKYYMNAGSSSNGFILKLDTAKAFIWSKIIGSGTGSVWASSSLLNDLTIDNSKNLYVTGQFYGSCDFDPSSAYDSLSCYTSQKSAFVSKLDSGGNHFWARKLSGTGIAKGVSLSVDQWGNIAATGNFEDSAYADNTGLLSTGGTDVYILNLSTNGVLPVKLMGFNAVRKGDNAELNWQTASEEQSLAFDVERSLDGVKYQKIGSVKAAGHSSTYKCYHFTDVLAGNLYPKQNLYYRLKQVDIDGGYTYSAVRLLRFDKMALPPFSIYPNPGNAVFMIKAGADLWGATYKVLDLTGQQLYNGTITQEENTVDLSFLQAGIYTVVINNIAYKFIKE